MRTKKLMTVEEKEEKEGFPRGRRNAKDKGDVQAHSLTCKHDHTAVVYAIVVPTAQNGYFLQERCSFTVFALSFQIRFSY